MYTIDEIRTAVDGVFIRLFQNDAITHLVFDSRRVQLPAESIFFAIVTTHNDGHHYLAEAYEKGIRNFVVSQPIAVEQFQSANFIQVPNTLKALQQLASFHRAHFDIPIIGVTGSNGKTVVKEWLYHLLQDQFSIVRSPRSYNSQLGVALSLWQIHAQHNLGIFEAGISSPGEMEQLQWMMQPTIGILTNLGEAHDGGFRSREEKMKEKMKLFAAVDILIGEYDLIKQSGYRLVFTWGENPDADLKVIKVEKARQSTKLTAMYKGVESTVSIPFTDEASIQNAFHCWAAAMALEVPFEKIEKGFASLHAIDMRLQLKHGINDCLVVNDSYSADITSLRIALDFLQQQSSGLKRTVILSDFAESATPATSLAQELAALLTQYNIQKLVVVGHELAPTLSELLPAVQLQSYGSTEDLIMHFRPSSFYKEIILVKGARKFGFERVAALFEQKQHQTVLEINLNALAHNLRQYQSVLQPGTKLMAMVKAFSYGSGTAEIASVLQFHHIDYLGVAYADEGAELVRSGIAVPIMVMNAEPSSFQSIVDHDLQPVIYSFELLHQFELYLREQGMTQYPVHLELETGMNRLGFAPEDVDRLGAQLAKDDTMIVQSVFSHLAASEDPAEDNFTQQQAALFGQGVEQLKKHIERPFLCHIVNSAGIIRHRQWHLDMVRLGIGLYGVEPDQANELSLETVATLRSTIAQLKTVKKGGSVGYNRKGKVQRDSIIATVRIGYADGYSRMFGHGKGKMYVNGKLAPVIGTVCMDMTMIDVTDIPGVREGDDVIIFGAALPVEEVAGWMGTIPYELMTAVSQRVKRIYFHE